MNSRFDNFYSLAALRMHRKFFSALFFSALLGLGGCGGDGASTTSVENDLPSPVAGGIDGEVLVPGPAGKDPVPGTELELLPKVSVGPRQFADPNVLLTLRATAEAAEGAQITKTLWTQVSGPGVQIPRPTGLINIILMPDVNVATTIEFRFTAEDSEGRVNSATVGVLVKPVPTFVKVIGGVFNEANGAAKFVIRLNAPSDLPVTVAYVTQDGTADSETDYLFAAGNLVFAPGEVSKEVAITLLDDVIEEDVETFTLQATAINGATTYANTGVAIIRNGIEPQLQQSIQFSDPGPVSIFVNDEYTNPLDSTVVSPGTGDLVYVSSNPEVASVDANGLVTGLALGTTQITVIKYADDVYLSAEASYQVQVVIRGTVPTVETETQDGYSVQWDESIFLYGTANDLEDGPLPTQAEIDAYELNGTPITSVRWDSSIDGFLGNGYSLSEIGPLSEGTHVITYSVTDSDKNVGTTSFRLLVGNIAPLAFTEASSSYCPDINSPLHCYSPFRVNDTSLSTLLGGENSWVNDLGNEATLDPRPWVGLNWSSPVTINSIDLYTSEDYAIRDYDIEYLGPDGQTWVVAVSVTGNAAVFRSHPIAEITTTELRVLARLGSSTQPGNARVNELVVFGKATSGSSSSAGVF